MIGEYLETVILYCLHQINGERSIYSIFHLLNGKKSSQTIQDAHLYKLDKFFQIYEFISREEFDQKIHIMNERNLIKLVTDQHYLVTNAGNKELMHQLSEKPLPKFLNGWGYHSVSGVFWERLSLLIQVCSNLVHDCSEYLPVQRKLEIQIWVKKFIQQTGMDRKELGINLHSELISCFEPNPALDPSVLVFRLTGYNRIGLTSKQTAQELKLEFTYYHLQFLNLLHFMIKTIETKPKYFQLLGSIIKDIASPYSFTISTKKTYELIQKGMNAERIADVRNLKKSTIEDHIVEIALLNKSFDISPFVTAEKQKKILLAAKQAESKQLKQIVKLTAGINYFEIRLVLAKFGET